MNNTPPVLCLMGPTASGKTALAVALARSLPCDVISVDSALVYRGMDIGTAKPDAQTLAQVPHRLIDIRDPSESYSAAEFRADALQHIAEIRARGRIPLLVGGTGLYFRALQQGLSPLPSADAALRQRLERQAQVEGWPAMHARLAQLDPEAAQRIHQNDPQRIQRALEVCTLAGRPMSALLREQQASPLPFSWVKFALWPHDRELLRARIAERFRDMMARGFLREVEMLYRRDDLHPNLPALRAVGYRQLWAHLAGLCSRQEAVERGIIATRQYAKRQLTWLRSEVDLCHLDSEDKNNYDRVLKYLDEATI